MLRFESSNPTRDVYFNCADLNLEDGSSVAATKTYYSLAGGTVNLGGTVSVIATSDREARIRSELRGTGTLKFESAASGSSQPNGKLYIHKENTNFFGTIDTTLLRTSYATFDANFQSLYIWYGTSIGGNLETLNRAALILNHYVRFGPGSATPVTIREESNRGILVRNGAVINVISGRALTIGQNDLAVSFVGILLSYHYAVYADSFRLLVIYGCVVYVYIIGLLVPGFNVFHPGVCGVKRYITVIGGVLCISAVCGLVPGDDPSAEKAVHFVYLFKQVLPADIVGKLIGELFLFSVLYKLHNGAYLFFRVAGAYALGREGAGLQKQER